MLDLHDVLPQVDLVMTNKQCNGKWTNHRPRKSPPQGHNAGPLPSLRQASRVQKGISGSPFLCVGKFKFYYTLSQREERQRETTMPLSNQRDCRNPVPGENAHTSAPLHTHPTPNKPMFIHAGRGSIRGITRASTLG